MRIVLALLLLLLGMLVLLPGCFLGERLGYIERQPEQQLLDQIKGVIEKPPSTNKDWLYFLVGTGMTMGAIWVKYRFFHGGTPGVDPKLPTPVTQSTLKSEATKKAVPIEKPTVAELNGPATTNPVADMPKAPPVIVHSPTEIFETPAQRATRLLLIGRL